MHPRNRDIRAHWSVFCVIAVTWPAQDAMQSNCVHSAPEANTPLAGFSFNGSVNRDGIA